MSEEEIREFFLRVDDVVCGLRDAMLGAVAQDANGSINKRIGNVYGEIQWPYQYSKLDLRLEIKAEIPRKEEAP